MKTFKNFVEQTVKFDNWVRPSKKDIALEYKVEHELKGLNLFNSLKEFEDAVKNAKVIKLTKDVDSKIAYRSRTRNKQALLNLIKGYRSYPEFRNEKTLQAIYDGFNDNRPMKMPFVLQWPDGKMRIMSGNTRTDVANHLGIIPNALLIKVPKK